MTAMRAHRAANGVLRRAMPRGAAPAKPRSNWQLWRRCWEGTEPAESLSTRDREDLIWDMVAELGWTDREIAEHTRSTDYTVARIRNRLGLESAQQRLEEAS